MILICLVYELCGEKGIRILAAVSMILFMIGVLGTSYLPLGEQIPVLGDFTDGNIILYSATFSV